uniref:Transmembrane protein n=1 Tax=Pseudo-nitzschia australis TaxID=44445 RepID=A0A7S4EQI8_9STRA|mmetsp:Transcript_1673/g.3151  ORF Transcript_1673/g.3151 Transcript_1673/m.3151 type:complete len:146 (-) Transcript_1673:107-544(-)
MFTFLSSLSGRRPFSGAASPFVQLPVYLVLLLPHSLLWCFYFHPSHLLVSAASSSVHSRVLLLSSVSSTRICFFPIPFSGSSTFVRLVYLVLFLPHERMTICKNECKLSYKNKYGKASAGRSSITSRKLTAEGATRLSSSCTVFV